MLVTTQIPCGNGRVLRANPEAIEIELIAYSKGSRYVSFKIHCVDQPRRQLVLLRPDRHFRIPDFRDKFHSQIWVKRGSGGTWEVVGEENIERLPEVVRFHLELTPGKEYFVSTEPFREYTESTRELASLAQAHSAIARLHCIGHSIEHRPIFALRVSDEANFGPPGEEKKPVIHVVCGEHASEFAGEEIGRGMLALALAKTKEARFFRRDFIFDFILNANPDGNFHGWHQYNARDWLAHNYRDTVDRSWHHEFARYYRGEPGDYSPETRALMDWLLLTRPAFYVSMHSWEGHEGKGGAYYTAPELLSPTMGQKIMAVNESAIRAACDVGESFIITSSRQANMHLGECLMIDDLALAYLPEGHINWGHAKLEEFGTRLLRYWLQDERLNVRHFDAAIWKKRKKAKLQTEDIR